MKGSLKLHNFLLCFSEQNFGLSLIAEFCGPLEGVKNERKNLHKNLLVAGEMVSLMVEWLADLSEDVVVCCQSTSNQ